MKKQSQSGMFGLRIHVFRAGAALLCLGASHAFGVQTWLAFRSAGPLPICGGSTCQTLLTSFGTNLATLPFTGSIAYHFYSPPLTNAITMVPSDKGGGVVYMRNTAGSSANDFSVSGRMQFFDYDPAAGTESLIVDTTASPAKNVNHGQMVNWALPNALLPGTIVIPAGHMIHIAATVTLVSGNPGVFGQLVYNGPSGPSTSGLLPQNRSTTLDWSFSTTPFPPSISSIADVPNGAKQITGGASPGGSIILEATASLSRPNWVTLVSTNADGNGLFTFVDQDAASFPVRFYRAKTP